MDRFGHSTPSLDELKQIQEEIRSTKSIKQLRGYFERIQELRRIHSGNFDVQLQVAEAQEEVIQRARDLRSRAAVLGRDEESFEGGAPPLHRATAAPPPVPVDPVDEDEADFVYPGNKNWRRATWLALILTAVICIVFFYLIQTARKINLSPPAEVAAAQPSSAGKIPVQNAKAVDAAVSTSPTVRLYTDLIPGTVSVDDGEGQDLKDGELVLDRLEPGRHSIKVAGRSGSAAFSFDVAENTAPQPVAPITAANAIAVLVSAQGGKGRLLTSLPESDIAVDSKPVGQAGPDGLAIAGLGTADHDLQVGQGDDRQRFVLTYTAAPVLTVYVKSVLNLGTVTVVTKQDGASIFIQDKLYRRKTGNGQIRIPLKVGTYVIHVHKDGFVDPPAQTVEVKKSEESELSFTLDPRQLEAAYLDVRGAPPGTAVYVDKEQVAVVSAEGHAGAKNLTSGEHAIELRLAGAVPRKFEREFEAGKTVSLTGSDTVFEKVKVESAVPEQPAAPPAPVESAAAAASSSVDIPGEEVKKGGGFVHYNVPKTSGRYSFQAHSKIGGFLKHEKLQWYAGYENSENYVLFSVDGKHASVRAMKSGKSEEINRIPFNASSDEWVQVDLSIQPGAINTRIRTPRTGWSDLGTVPSEGRDFTQDRVGFYVPGNDEVAVANFRFASH